MFIRYKCPICGKPVKVSIWTALFREAKCATCGPASQWYRCDRQGNSTRIIIPPDRIPYLVHLLTGIIVAHVAMGLVSNGEGMFIMTILSVFFVAAAMMGPHRQTPDMYLSFAEKFLYPKEVVCRDGQIKVRVFSDEVDPKRMSFSCHTYMTPTVGVTERKVPRISLSSGDGKIQFGYGLSMHQLEEIKADLDDYIQREVTDEEVAKEETKDEPSHAFEKQEPVVITEDMDTAKTLSHTKTTAKTDGKKFVLETVARWDAADWGRLLLVAVGVFAILHLLWEMRIPFGISIGLGAGILCFMQGIKVVMEKDAVEVNYTYFGFISRTHRIPFSEILDIGETGLGNCAVLTAKKSYRVTHFNSRKSRFEVANILKRELKKRTSWSPRCRFAVKRDDGGAPAMITLPPAAGNWFQQSGFHPIALVPIGIMGLPMFAGLQLLILTLLRRFLEFGEWDAFEHMGTAIILNGLLLAWIIYSLTFHKNTLSFEPSYPDEFPTLTIRRPFEKIEFNLNHAVDIQCICTEMSSSSCLQLSQEKQEVNVGGGLNWEEQQELLGLLRKIIDETRERIGQG